MTTKLTLSLDPEVTAAARRFAAARGTTVSRLVESFLRTVTRDPETEPATPILARLRGSLRDVDIPDHRAHLESKYG